MLRSTRLEDCPTKRSHRLLHWSGPDKNDIFPKSESSLILTSQVTTCNSLLAIFAGLLSDLLVRGFSLGPLAPFLAALVSSHHSWEKWFCLQEPDYSGFSPLIFWKNFPNLSRLYSLSYKYFLQPCLAAGLLMISLGWSENYGSQTGSLVEKYR